MVIGIAFLLYHRSLENKKVAMNLPSLPPISDNLHNVVQKVPFAEWMQTKRVLFAPFTGSPLDIIVCGIKIGLVIGYGNECRKAFLYKRPDSSSLSLVEDRTLVERIERGAYTAIKSTGSFIQLVDFIINLGWLTVKKVSHVVIKIFAHVSGVIWFSWDAISDLIDIEEVNDLAKWAEKIKYCDKKDFFYYKMARLVDFIAKFFFALHSGFELCTLVSGAAVLGFSGLFLIAGVVCFIAAVIFQMSDTSKEKIEYLRATIPSNNQLVGRRYVYKG